MNEATKKQIEELDNLIKKVEDKLKNCLGSYSNPILYTGSNNYSVSYNSNDKCICIGELPIQQCSLETKLTVSYYLPNLIELAESNSGKIKNNLERVINHLKENITNPEKQTDH